MNPIRVLHVVGGMHRGGMETLIMNLYRKIDRNQIQFDFLVHRQRKGAYEDEIASLGGKVYHLTFRDDLNFIKYRKDLNAFFAGHPEYRVVHGHHSALGRFYLKAAKNGGVPVRIAHAHHAQYNHTLRGSLSHLLELGFPKYATEYFACTQSAGAFLLGKDKRCFVVANGVDPAAYAFSTERRNATRRALGLGNCFAVGHVGRFSREKNHAFLLRVFGELLKLQDDARLLLIGGGPLREAVERQARDMGIAGQVMFLGVREDVPDLLQAMDVFLLPSLFEGLPLTLLEAQSAGLPVICSDVVTRECALSPLYQACSLRTPPREWARLALAAAAGEEARRENNRYIVESDFNILRVAAQLQEKYLQLANRG